MMKSWVVTETLMYKNSCLSMAVKSGKGWSYKTDVMLDERKTIKGENRQFVTCTLGGCSVAGTFSMRFVSKLFCVEVNGREKGRSFNGMINTASF